MLRGAIFHNPARPVIGGFAGSVVCPSRNASYQLNNGVVGFTESEMDILFRRQFSVG